MRRLTLVTFAFVLASASFARAQAPPPRIGPFAFDLHGTFARFPTDQDQLFESRGLTSLLELPGGGFGIQVGAHVYPLHFKAVTFGIGGEFAAARSSQTPPAGAIDPTTGLPLKATQERFSTVSPQLSLNFGTGHGWSYLSAGLGTSNHALVPEGQEGFPGDSEALRTLNYGGGARWFAKSHLAFSLDVRIYNVAPGTSYLAGAPGAPRMTLLVIGAGVSLK
jgi:hypothetical protein